ncbi:hypothetical protein A7Q03_06240 [Eikenella sp. NML99-0057]|nr:hypothetical protein A7Q03_06240 [Eikenella sp. NML99-0057]
MARAGVSKKKESALYSERPGLAARPSQFLVCLPFSGSLIQVGKIKPFRRDDLQPAILQATWAPIGMGLIPARSHNKCYLKFARNGLSDTRARPVGLLVILPRCNSARRAVLSVCRARCYNRGYLQIGGGAV